VFQKSASPEYLKKIISVFSLFFVVIKSNSGPSPQEVNLFFGGYIMKKPKLLIVEDDESIRTQMKWAMVQDYEVFTAEDRPSALEIARQERPAVVTLDLGLPPNPAQPDEGLATLAEILAEDSLTKVIIISGQGQKDNALKAVSEGAYDFFSKPINTDELKVVLHRAYHVSQLERENLLLQQQVAGQPFAGMLGSSPQMEGVFADIRKVAPTDVSVLINGESGTGKELVAKAIHQYSNRSRGPFVVINCGAIPENLLESELFGHEKGSFTGAHMQRKGRIETADGGTLFLDEIGELPLNLQVKILRFLQEQMIDRVGGRVQIAVNVRVLAATNQDLKLAVAEGRYREDLYFRLGVVTLTLPPLRDREGDLPLLANAFLQRYAHESRKKITGFTLQALKSIGQYDWPGNIRELENRIKRAVVMAEGSKINPVDLEMTTALGKYQGLSLKESRDALEKEMIKKSLHRNKGNITQTADELGISRPTLYELMEKLKITK
jgi:two-component system NtrC family response regulator